MTFRKNEKGRAFDRYYSVYKARVPNEHAIRNIHKARIAVERHFWKPVLPPLKEAGWNGHQGVLFGPIHRNWIQNSVSLVPDSVFDKLKAHDFFLQRRKPSKMITEGFVNCLLKEHGYAV